MATKSPFSIVNETPVWALADRSKLWLLAGADIDGDGTGGNPENDPDFQSTTSYKPDRNARRDLGFVLPGSLMEQVPGVVLGCKGRATNITNGLCQWCSPLDVGPNDKIGEIFIALARALGIPSSPINGGTNDAIILYEFWPGIPGIDPDGNPYILQPYAA